MAENQTMSSWDRIRNGVADVENLMDQKQYNLSMVRGRQTLEYMINYLAQSVRLQAPDMSTAIDELYNLKIISSESRDNYHNIRILGNGAVHEGNNSAADAASSYQMLSREVYAFADSYAKTARRVGQMIKNGQEVPTRAEAVSRSTGYSSQGKARSSGSAAASRASGTAAGGNTTRIPRTAASRGSYEPEIGLNLRTRTTGTAAQRSAASATEGARRSTSQRSSSYEARRSSGYQGARSSSSGARRTEGRNTQARRSGSSSATIAGISPEIILKIMIPIILVILLIAVIRFVTSKSSAGEEATTAAATSAAETMQVVTAAPIPVETTQAQTEPETTQAPVYKYTTTDSLKVRTAPGTDAGVIALLEPGTEVTFIEQTDDKWSKISYNGSEAYVATEYLKKEQVQ